MEGQQPEVFRGPASMLASRNVSATLQSGGGIGTGSGTGIGSGRGAGLGPGSGGVEF